MTSNGIQNYCQHTQSAIASHRFICCMQALARQILLDCWPADFFFSFFFRCGAMLSAYCVAMCGSLWHRYWESKCPGTNQKRFQENSVKRVCVVRKRNFSLAMVKQKKQQQQLCASRTVASRQQKQTTGEVRKKKNHREKGQYLIDMGNGTWKKT